MSPWLREANVAWTALLAGILVGSVEFVRPGWVIPGTVGATLLMLGIAGLSTHPWHPLGTGLLVLAIAAAFADVAFHWHGWGAGAAALLVVAGLRLAHPARPAWPVALLAGATVVAVWRLLQLAAQAKANKAP